MCRILCYDSNGNVVKHLNQGDVDISFVVSNVDSTVVPFLQICNRKNVTTLAVDATRNDDGSLTAFIPNELLAQAEVIIIYICQSAEEGLERTLCEMRFHVRPYPRKRLPTILTVDDGEEVNL